MSDNYTDVSDLEREFELEMEGPQGGDFESSFEAGDGDFAHELELETDDEVHDDLELSFEQEEFERELQGGLGDARSEEFVDRLLEIGSRQFESPYEADSAMSEVLDDIEREYFFGALKRGLKKLGKNKLLRSLATKGMTLGVNKFFPGLKGALQLARGNVKGALLNFGKQALGSVVPGAGAILDSVKAIGLDPVGGSERETWENYVDLSREAYEHLAENLTPAAHQPAEAMRLASDAVQHAIASARARAGSAGAGPAARSSYPQGQPHRRHHGRVMHLRVARGERVKLVIMGV